MPYDEFFNYMKQTEQKVFNYIIENYRNQHKFEPYIIDQSVLSYITRGGKRLRPIVLLMACGAVGGAEEIAMPVAGAVELFHTWTLVHDDLIDDDHLRRGKSTIHHHVSQHALNELGLDQRKATNYGRDIAILTGDVQHGWSIAMLTDPKLVNNTDAAVVFELIKQMQTTVLTTLVHGEVLDVEFGLKNQDILDIPEEKIIQMLWMKTGILYEYSGLAGAMIGKNSSDMNDPEIVALKTFCSNCGTAFQLRDDILGITGDEKNLGKPIGSDIREGKKTTIIRAALTHASKKEKKAILDVLGKKDSTLDEISRVTNLLKNLGGIDHTYDLSVEYIKKALPSLDVLKASRYKTYLKQWANYMIERNF